MLGWFRWMLMLEHAVPFVHLVSEAKVNNKTTSIPIKAQTHHEPRKWPQRNQHLSNQEGGTAAAFDSLDSDESVNGLEQQQKPEFISNLLLDLRKTTTAGLKEVSDARNTSHRHMNWMFICLFKYRESDLYIKSDI